MKAPAFFVLQILCLLGQHGATQSRRYDDARIADELGRLLKRPQLPRYTGPDFHLEYPVIAKNGVTLAGVTYSLGDFSLPWRLVRHYAQMQLSTYKLAAGNPVMRAAIARHNAERMTDFLSHVEVAGSRRAQFGHGNVHVVQASGLVYEVNVYVIASLVAAVVVLFTTYCAYIIAKHVTRLLDSVPQPVPQEQTPLLQATK
ncbi:uncharacterized protein LOC119372324 [Rhipicephalus sanguineus]|uniref:uncharacterized protein LOC119372324 n=1 Tax=Rhipicephalus sanguineus TaxID=34632 RepID=UPI001894C8B3|nr:uncharacterized protein LOC119372324 [Rhipicephalus sanguineus]